MLDRNRIKVITKNNDYLKSKLFCKGFLITSAHGLNTEEYPFYGKWKVVALNNHWSIFSHLELKIYLKNKNGYIVGLIGHAYNPIDKKYSEDDILNELHGLWKNRQIFFEKINELTGVFCLFVIEEEKIVFLNDAVGLQSVFYSHYQNNVYVSSHSNLIGDLLGLNENEYVRRLKKCRTYHLFGNQLPGNISQFDEVERLNPNHYVVNNKQMEQIRFYWPAYRNEEYAVIKSNVIDLLKQSMFLISQKWEKPAIALTGGCDSKTILACTKDYYDKFKYFSYDSQLNERPDAIAAGIICENLNLKHMLYNIPYDDSSFDDYEKIRDVLIWNGGNVRDNNPNDVRKRIYLDEINDFDIEVKGWASEVGRARYTKRYNGRKNFGSHPTPRKCTTFYKFLFFDRGLVRKTDKIFKNYIEHYFETSKKNPIPWQDQFYWEWHWPSRDGVCLTCEHMFSNDITVPYNNRKILELLLSVSEEERVHDTLYTDIRNELDSRIDKSLETVNDVNHTKKRAIFENIYYICNNLLPF